ncbi:hypothetical protein ACSLNH_07705 [Comamonas kerstersii]|uniref:hypothetical protein n=1 Tax=Comamonas kerstersii TaxID=225992 RepID=UPI0020466C2A|nr:MAG TPA: hypothetical protein [Caudoviricetes sp.]
MNWIAKSFLCFWPGVVALAYALLALDGIWQRAMLNGIGITYVAIAPLIALAWLQDKRPKAK